MNRARDDIDTVTIESKHMTGTRDGTDSRRTAIAGLQTALAERLIGHERLIERLLIALLCEGHLLLEGPPGVAKTRAVKCFAALVDASFARVQATPDLLPADLTGTDMYVQQSGEFRFLPGPLFNHILLIDEVNRAPPKVQSALLEAMGEHQITTAGTTRVLSEPFLVAATQNPLEHEGTYPLPEAQLDRFMFFVELRLPDSAMERHILDQVLREDRQRPETGETETSAIVTRRVVLQARHDVRTVHLAESVRDFIVRLVMATRLRSQADDPASRPGDSIAHPASPRASIHLARAAQARAWLHGRDHATPDDVVQLAPDVLAGRLALDYRARADGLTARDLVEQIIDRTARV